MKGRFYNLGYGLSVALQSNVTQGADLTDYLKKGFGLEDVVYNKGKGQIFHRAEEIERSNSDPSRKIIFSVATNGKESKRKLVFFSKTYSIAARFGEEKPFGFDRTRPGPNYRGRDYLLLDFPGITGIFSPVFVKIKPRGKKTFLHVKIRAEKNENGRIAITASPAGSVPRHLYFFNR